MSRKEYYSEEQYEQEQYEETAMAEGESADVESMYDDVAENDLKMVYQLIDMLRREMETAKNVPFSSNRIVDTEKCLNMLDDLEDTLPDAVKRAAWTIDRSENMLRQAEDETTRHIASLELQHQKRMEKREQNMDRLEKEANARAAKIISDAEKKAANMVRQGVIESGIEDEIRAIRSNAQAQANELQLRVEDECFKKLDTISMTMGKMIKEINRMRAEFEEE